ncbi:uncharacterized protein FOMMEDRAFT_129995 [Fomitiporia mediterranea MF3/22]|uniref:uncharacterized protein n=1 Tax=Fomitiporia mediterranea (strain MF3/22) TaxID=694068 RepID=UPI0004409389|nr:uncharacterized protein FOMMEDRAFT_129995 [Fomitiporia mediterranea MF3/22]EJC98043.1 hypothetical protein FOMMEDRAFT_129995 [Fomitiporia mediterranea MF3/22]
MYIAGIHVPTSDLATEGVVTSSLFIFTVAMIRNARKMWAIANANGGPLKSDATTLVGKLLTPLHGSAFFLPVLTYLIAIPLNKGVQPEFITHWALPDFGLQKETINLIRMSACASLAISYKAVTKSISLLRHSFHGIGVREKSRIVSTGLFSVVRHPAYATALLGEFGVVVMFWNYAPLLSFAICAVVFVMKIPIEEELLESDANVGPEYVAYKKRVPYRLIPGIW